MDCPAIDQKAVEFTQSQTSKSQSFTYHCGLDWLPNDAAEGGQSVQDLMGLVAYSVDDCVSACLGYNLMAKPRNQTLCEVVTFRRDMKAIFAAAAGNCFLKSGRPSSVGRGNVNALAAVLKTSSF